MTAAVPSAPGAGREDRWRIPALFLRAVVRRDARFLAATLASCAIAAIIATFQYSVFTSFMRAGAVIPRHLDGDFWVTAAGVECFDFPDLINEDYAGLVARYAPRASYRRVVFGFATWRSPVGRRSNVALVGVDGLSIPPNSFIADRSDLARLDLSASVPGEASIGDTTLTLGRVEDDLPTFLGVPYVVVPFETARGILRLEPGTISYLVGDLPEGAQLSEQAIAQAGREFPDIALIQAGEFQRTSSAYWLNKTGAGLAILLASALAGILMVFLLAGGVLRFVQRYHADLLSLLGHGALEREIAATIAGFALLVAAGTLAVTIAATPVLVQLFQPLLPWIGFQLVDLVVPFGVIGGAFAIVIVVARGAMRAFAPEAVFRA